MNQFTGTCLCGAVQFTASEQPLRIGICHCRDCRRHHGAAFYAAAVFDRHAVTITGTYAAHAGRAFCPECGSSVFARCGDEIELHLGALSNGETLVPTYELWTEQRLPWVQPLPAAQQFARGRD
ncbi:Uncharacterized conserved protein [Yoonia tamlensis]|uniref:Uncharacterized conserved protein n=1 Tax=Yoonia tamlensis TaxID=390270 RepID=A0A1I6GMR4_9RHOB|nr:GFA family protein [Yoonia tamlensis]SFR43513.1 Uncharacterized conserved protein [Yoonia tamlensis]